MIPLPLAEFLWGLSGLCLVRWGAMLGILGPVERSSGLHGLGVHPLAGPAWLGSKLTVLAGNPLGRAGAAENANQSFQYRLSEGAEMAGWTVR